ncbi:DUF1444 family protein [Rhizobium sp. P38BS-XIX]|uniref:DUF1444 family protein n=1 Tax=Rhizobium sp. P38BS-XIX TaxID=2726740 RepID=UPI001457109E|nr:DUF1444 family protein [Rhizobium sp. P38BS-XIX]NLS00091.1 DUF1444 family protein [Rhizobium sp. P38BS-XIX]
MSFLKKLFQRAEPKEQTLSVADYIERYAAFVRQRYPDTAVTVHLGENATLSHVAWVMPNGTQAKQYFGNWYTRYRNGEDELGALFQGQLDEAHAIDQPRGAIDASRIFPVLKPADWADTARHQLAAGNPVKPAPLFLIRPFMGDLVVTYVLDTEDNMQFVTKDMLQDLGVEEAALHDKALANLQQFLPSLEIEGNGGRFVARLDRNYDASMLLIFALWRERIAIEGDILVATPSRDEFLFVPADDVELKESLAEIAGEIKDQAAYPLSSQIMRWANGQFMIENVG